MKIGTTGTALNFGNTTTNPTVGFTGSGTFGTTTGAVSLNGNTTVVTGKTLTVTNGLTSLGGGLTVTNGGNVAFQKATDNSTTGTLNNVAITGAFGPLYRRYRPDPDRYYGSGRRPHYYPGERRRQRHDH